jgi:YgiT-type zinc finger domain-containing protein
MGVNLINFYVQNRQENGSEVILCKNCAGGRMIQRPSTYFSWMGDELIAVPDFPLWQCDVCKHCEYDPQARQYLKSMFNRNGQTKFTGYMPYYRTNPLSK